MNYTDYVLPVNITGFPKLGMSGYELTDIWLSIASIAAVIIMAIVIAVQVGIQNKQLSAQIKSNSSIVIRSFYNETYGDSEFSNELAKLNHNSEDMMFDDERLDKFLDHFEGLAIDWADHIVTNNHVYQWFGKDLNNMYKCYSIMKYIDKTRKNPYPLYDNLYNLIHKNQKWGH